VYTASQGWQGLSSGANGKISALALAADGRLYAGGSFTTIGGTPARNIAVWNGSSWQALGGGTSEMYLYAELGLKLLAKAGERQTELEAALLRAKGIALKKLETTKSLPKSNVEYTTKVNSLC
jgi:hypothetical protein